MKQRLLACLCAAMLLALCACGGEEAEQPNTSLPPEPSVAESSEEQLPEPAIDDEEDVFEPDGNCTVTVYAYRPEGGRYFPVEVWLQQDTIPALLDVVTSELGLPALHAELDWQDEHLTIGLPEEYIDEVLADPEVETILLNTLCATITCNKPEIQTVCLARGDAAYQSVNLSLTQGEPYRWPEIQLGGGTPAEYEEIRARVPYLGLNPRSVQMLRYDIVPTDETGEELTQILARIGDPRRNISSVLELGNSYILIQGLKNVQWHTTYDYGQGEHVTSELAPITMSVGEDTVALAEHVYEVCTELFGEISLIYDESDPWVWHSIEGVYTQPRISDGYDLQPVILDYEESDTEFRIEVVYLLGTLGQLADETGEIIPEEQLANAVEHELPKREVVLRKTAGGGLVFTSHRYL